MDTSLLHTACGTPLKPLRHQFPNSSICDEFNKTTIAIVHGGSRAGAVVRALTSHQFGLSLIPRLGVMWVEFVVDSLPCSER